MAKKIISGIGSVFQGGAIGIAKSVIGKKKKADEPAAPAATKKGPIITQLGRSAQRPGAATILSDRLGS